MMSGQTIRKSDPSVLTDLISLCDKLNENLWDVMLQVDYNDPDAIKKNWVEVLDAYQRFVNISLIIENCYISVGQSRMTSSSVGQRASMREEIIHHRQILNERLSILKSNVKLPEMNDGTSSSSWQAHSNPQERKSLLEHSTHQNSSDHSNSSDHIDSPPILNPQEGPAQYAGNAASPGNGKGKPGAPVAAQAPRLSYTDRLQANADRLRSGSDIKLPDLSHPPPSLAASPGDRSSGWRMRKIR